MTENLNLQKFIMENKSMGFDAIALNYGCTVDKAKSEWNKLGLGWNLTPKTLIEMRRVAHNQYEILKDITIFIAPALPIIVTKGSVTDFASVPRFFHFFIDKDDNSIAIPALAHDALYASEYFDRKVADTVLMALMKYAGAGFITRHLVYFAVRIGGRFVWKGHNKDDVKARRNDLLQAIENYYKNSNYKNI